MNYYRVEGKLCCAFEEELPFEKIEAPEKEAVLREGLNFLFARPEAECRASFLVNDLDLLFQETEDVSWLNKNKLSVAAETFSVSTQSINSFAENLCEISEKLKTLQPDEDEMEA